MRYLKLFEDVIDGVEESKEQIEYDQLMGQLLHVYGSIPVPKEKSRVVIGKIVVSNLNRFYEINEDVDLQYQKIHDQVRFVDYFSSLIKSKSTRGHNFEGLIAGLFGGTLSKSEHSKWDVEINGKHFSVKFVDNASKSPQLGSFTNSFSNETKEEILREGGLPRLFQGENDELKARVFRDMSRGVNGWLIGYPSKDGSKIVVNHITKMGMKKLLVDTPGLSGGPKNGYNREPFSCGLSATYKNYNLVRDFDIIIPKLSIEELRKEVRNVSEEEWSDYVFGEYGAKIRPDVLRYIHKNQQQIITRMSNFKSKDVN